MRKPVTSIAFASGEARDAYGMIPSLAAQQLADAALVLPRAS